jgi:adenylate cyclase
MDNNPQEIERKFLVKNDDWKKKVHQFYDIEQYYLSMYPNTTVRIRKSSVSPSIIVHTLTFKSPTENVMVRNEIEMDITDDKYEALKHLSKFEPITKTRHIVDTPDLRTWEVDIFHGDLEGLTLAEIEISDPNETVFLPDWIGEEVTGNPFYTNDFMVTQK